MESCGSPGELFPMKSPRMPIPITEVTDHRPWPLPRRPWILSMSWRDLLFAHWPVPPEAIAASLPAGLEPDLHPGPGGRPTAWLGVVPFRMSRVRLRGTPPLPGPGAFPELNVRTYVRPARALVEAGAEPRPGVWFYSLDAASRIAVAGARAWFHLPYVHARMAFEGADEAPEHSGGGGSIRYRSRRRRAPHAEFEAEYGPVGEPFESERGTLEHWLTERYCLWAARPDGTLLRGEVHHRPWPLQRAQARIDSAALVAAAGLPPPEGEPHLLFARRLDVVAFAPRRVELPDPD